MTGGVPADPSGFEAITARESGLERRLGVGQLSMIAIGGAIGTGLFLGSGFAIGFAGPAVVISYAIGGVIALLLMGCLAEMAVANPVSGSFGAYAEFYVGPWFGFLVRYAYWSSIVLAVGTEVTAVAIYMKFWFPDVPGLVWIIGFSAILIGVNVASVGAFGALEYVFSALKMIAILIFILLATLVVVQAPPGSGIGVENYQLNGGLFAKGPWGVWVGVIVSIFSYLSIEMIAVAAAEARDPERAIVAAFRATFARLVVFYLLTLGLTLAIVPWSEAGSGDSPFVRVMARTGVPGAAGIFNIVILVAALSAMNSQLYVTTRMMFSLSRAGHAPRRFGAVNGRGVPVAALALSTLGIAVAAGLMALSPDDAFLFMVSVSMFGAMFTWLSIFITHIFFRRRVEGVALRFRAWGYPVTSVAGAALMSACLVTTAFVDAFKPTLTLGIPFLGALAVIYGLWGRGAAAKRLGKA